MRICFDGSAAVPLTVLSIPSPQGEHVSLAVETRLMRGFKLLGLARSSRGLSRRFASASASGLGSVHGPYTGPPSFVGHQGGDGAFEVRRPRTSPVQVRAPEAACATQAGAGRLGGGRGRTSAALPTGHGARQAAHLSAAAAPGACARRRSVVVWIWAGEAREYCIVGSMASVLSAAKKKEWKKGRARLVSTALVQWRRFSLLPRRKSGRRSRCAARWRPLLAPSVVRGEPSA
jgi:hypothetical protein